MVLCFLELERVNMKNNKLFKVTLRGMKYSTTGVSEGVSYVVADNSDQAYQKVKKQVWGGVCGLWVIGRSAERLGAGSKIINNIIGKK